MSDNQKIVSYMNKFQKVALYDYLQYYKGINLPFDDSYYDVNLVDFSTEKMDLKYKDGKKEFPLSIPFQPPLKNVDEARSRFIEMAFKAADSLEVSPTRITKYVCPKSFKDITLFLSISAMMYILVAISFNITWPRDFNSFSPKTVFWIKRITIATLAIHVIELIFTVAPLLRKHRASVKVWISYLILTPTVGFPSWIPLKKKVAEIEAYRAKFEKK